METAKRIFRTCGQIFRYAVGHGLAERNPAADIKPSDVLKPTQTIHYARLDKKELPELLRKIDDYSGNPLTRLAMQLIALTFVRTGELIGARWHEIEFDARLWRIPAERMKKRRAHLVPLSDQAIALLQELKTTTGKGVFLFPNIRSPKQPMNKGTINAALGFMGYSGRLSAHAFRNTASTLLHEMGYSPDHIEMQLAHVDGSVRGRYNSADYLKDRRKLMQDWANYIDSLWLVSGE